MRMRRAVAVVVVGVLMALIIGVSAQAKPKQVTYPVTLTIGLRATTLAREPALMLVGQVQSRNPACKLNRRVMLLREIGPTGLFEEPGPTTDALGGWRSPSFPDPMSETGGSAFREAVQSGLIRYRVRVPRLKLERGACAAAVSDYLKG